MKSEIGQSVEVLSKKIWGKTLINNKIRSEKWWKRRLEFLINKNEDAIPLTVKQIQKTIDTPFQWFEYDMNMPNMDYDVFLTICKRMKSNK